MLVQESHTVLRKPRWGAQNGVRLLDEHTLEADITRDRSINFLFDELSKHNIEVLSMRNKTNRLEQLFVHMVENNEPSGDIK